VPRSRSSGSPLLRRLAWLMIILIVLALLAWLGWRIALGWAPSRDQYPLQGITVSEADGPLAWPTLKAMRTDFAYIRASDGTEKRDARFQENLNGAKKQGIRAGAWHEYSLCRLASDQASAFVTTVPRNNDNLPPAISLAFHDNCKERPGRSLVLAELNTLINQIESHAGKQAILRITPEFEDAYRISEGISRTVWLTGNYFPPDYAVKPWVMWQANAMHKIKGAPDPVRWNVVRP
jgi:lysozyme